MSAQHKLLLGLLAALGCAAVVTWVAAPVAESYPSARSAYQATAMPSRTPAPTKVPVGGKIQADNACYVRLQDMPPASYGTEGRYGMFGAYNPDTGVLVAAGGAGKASIENTFAFYQLYGVKLDSEYAQWNMIPYSGYVGYTREKDKGCREMTSVQITNTLALSVLGKDGCDNGRIDTKSKKGGDVRGVTIGGSADAAGIDFVPNMGVVSAPSLLAAKQAKLVRLFAAFDSTRTRVVLGQGTFDDERETETRHEVYEAHWIGTQVRVNQLFPAGPIPERRYGSCAAYVSDSATSVDGVLVLGGQEGGPTGTKTFNEVWWLDFTKSAQGEWMNITERFANQDEMGYRREGACAYNPASKQFYSWMGRADSKVPEGASRSGGTWRVDLSQLGDPAAPLTWERLAPDNLAGIKGRRLIPNVYDWTNNRLFVIGGRNNLDEYRDVWAIYPDVTGTACETLDPYAPYRPANPTATPVKPVVPTPEPLPVTPQACPGLTGIVPDPVIAAALADPTKVQGWGQLQNPGLQPGPNNPYRSRLGLQNPSAPYNPTYNSVVFKSGCP